MESGVGARASGGRRLLWPLIGVGFALGAVAVAVVLLTRTGGGPSLFDLPRTKACLDRSARVAATSTRKGDVDYIARDAGVGAIAVRFTGGVGATVVFERSDRAARQTDAVYTAVGGIGADFELSRNVVVAWRKSPYVDERSLIDGCLALSRA
jgi:hypothetical protein